ncbi:hypothetical protein GFL49_14365 [Rhizobium leguminosarum bv. viciae]|nr:hypothetical protein [Rhizobium leguminosarum bv. viciae]
MVEIHYRWHPLYGGCFRHEGREDRASGAIVRVEVRPGEVIQVAEWMLDRAFCAGMEMGEPRVAVAGLIELDRLLAERGFRQTSRGGLTAIQEARHEGITTTRKIANADPTQLSILFDAPQMRGLSDAERSAVVTRLATLLMAAAGVAAKEASDDEQ